MNEYTEAYRNGFDAHRRGVDVAANPYDPEAQAFSHEEWCSGWCARFSARKHDAGHDLLNEEPS